MDSNVPTVVAVGGIGALWLSGIMGTGKALVFLLLVFPIYHREKRVLPVDIGVAVLATTGILYSVYNASKLQVDAHFETIKRKFPGVFTEV